MFFAGCPSTSASLLPFYHSPSLILQRFVHFHKSTLATFAAAHASGTGLLPVPTLPSSLSLALPETFLRPCQCLEVSASVAAAASALHIKQFQFLAILFCSPCFIFFLSLCCAAFHCRRQSVAKAFRVADFDPETVFIVVLLVVVVVLCFALVFCINFCVIKYSSLMLQAAE